MQRNLRDFLVCVNGKAAKTPTEIGGRSALFEVRENLRRDELKSGEQVGDGSERALAGSYGSSVDDPLCVGREQISIPKNAVGEAVFPSVFVAGRIEHERDILPGEECQVQILGNVDKHVGWAARFGQSPEQSALEFKDLDISGGRRRRCSVVCHDAPLCAADRGMFFRLCKGKKLARRSDFP